MKDQLVELVQAQGYDFMTACELVSKCLCEFIASGKPSAKYDIGGASFTLKNNKVQS
jgi:hypothetical protein